MQDVDNWTREQGIQGREGEYVYTTKDRQGRNLQLIVETRRDPGNRHLLLKVDQFLEPTQDPNVTNREGGVHVGSTVYDYGDLRSINTMLAGGTVVGFSQPEDLPNPWITETIENAYGRVIGTSKLIRNRHEDPTKRVNPIDKGREYLQELQSATFLGSLDKETGTVVAPELVVPNSTQSTS